MNCAPSFDMVRKSLSPFLSINVTSLRSTMHFRLLSVRWVFFQLLLSSLTHNPTKQPCRIHRFSVGVSLMVILNTFTSLVRLPDSPPSRLWQGPAYRCLPNCGRPFLVRVRLPSACGLRYHRAQSKLRPSRLSSDRCHVRSQRCDFQHSA